jgi:hypothetical protein
MKYPAWYLVKDEGFVGYVDRVAGVRATLVANYPVGALGKHINQLAFALVPPLGADDDDGARIIVEHFRIESLKLQTKKTQPAARSQ